MGEGEIYQVPATGAVVSMNSAVGLVHFYCSQLPSDRYLSFLCSAILPAILIVGTGRVLFLDRSISQGAEVV